MRLFAQRGNAASKKRRRCGDPLYRKTAEMSKRLFDVSLVGLEHAVLGSAGASPARWRCPRRNALSTIGVNLSVIALPAISLDKSLRRRLRSPETAGTRHSA